MLRTRGAVFSRTLRRGDSGEDVRELQRLLRAAGFDPGPVDGNFGPATHAAVVALQRAQGLAPDGAAGPLTTAALARVVAQGDQSASGQRTALSLHIGLNHVDTAAYGSAVPDLAGCVNDANDMQDLARQQGFRVRQLLDSAATSGAVVSAIEQAAQELHSGDIFWISYSGHGSQVPDPLEQDALSETWVLWDRQLVDDELYALWGRFRAGVRVLVISDSCHSGTVTRELALLDTQAAQAAQADGSSRSVQQQPVSLSGGLRMDLALRLQDAMTTALEQLGHQRPGAGREVVGEVLGRLTGVDGADRALTTDGRPRLLAEDLAARDAASRREVYRSALAAAAGASAPVCSVLLLSGCQDNQTSSDGRPDPSGHQNGAFTSVLRSVWQTAGDYADLHDKILSRMPSTQSPNLYWATGRDVAFEAQRPLSV